MRSYLFKFSLVESINRPISLEGKMHAVEGHLQIAKRNSLRQLRVNHCYKLSPAVKRPYPAISFICYGPIKMVTGNVLEQLVKYSVNMF
ncbi:hypothetical protein R2Q26_02290 [Nitrosomonas sp. Is37]|nr:hypothetical protein [Nitrosomonas sp. Is37]